MKLKITDLSVTFETQTRAGFDESIVEEYKEAYLDKAKFPPITVYADPDLNQYWIADGFHRLEAAKRAGLTTIDAEVIDGDKLDAVICALSANTTHGMRRTNADKRHCVMVALKFFPDWSDRATASKCGVTHPFVANVRAELSKQEEVETVTTANKKQDSKKESAKTKNVKAEKSDAAETDEADAIMLPDIAEQDGKTDTYGHCLLFIEDRVRLLVGSYPNRKAEVITALQLLIQEIPGL